MAQGIYIGEKQIVVNWIIKDEDDITDLNDALNSDVCIRFLDNKQRYVKRQWVETYTSTKDNDMPGIGTRIDIKLDITYWAIDLVGVDYQWPLKIYRYPGDHCVMLTGFALDTEDFNRQLDYVIEECNITKPMYAVREDIDAQTQGRVQFLGDIPKDVHDTPAWAHTQSLCWLGKEDN